MRDQEIREILAARVSFETVGERDRRYSAGDLLKLFPVDVELYGLKPLEVCGGVNDKGLRPSVDLHVTVSGRSRAVEACGRELEKKDINRCL